MNEKFVALVQEKSASIYSISKQTGIPYTSLSELLNGKIDINKCAAGMVFRLSLYFNCTIEDLLNQESLISNSSGTYRKIKYKWIMGQNPSYIELHIWDRGYEYILDKGIYAQPRFYRVYNKLTEAIIDIYLEQKKAESMIYD